MICGTTVQNWLRNYEKRMSMTACAWAVWLEACFDELCRFCSVYFINYARKPRAGMPLFRTLSKGCFFCCKFLSSFIFWLNNLTFGGTISSCNCRTEHSIDFYQKLKKRIPCYVQALFSRTGMYRILMDVVHKKGKQKMR